MSLIDLLKKLAGPSSELLAFLNLIAQRYPDAAPKAQELAALLSSAVSPENLAAAGGAILSELANIGRGKLEPKNHPSDAA